MLFVKEVCFNAAIGLVALPLYDILLNSLWFFVVVVFFFGGGSTRER